MSPGPRSHVQALRFASKCAKAVEEIAVIGLEHVRVMLFDKFQHLDEVAMIIERRQVFDATLAADQSLVVLDLTLHVRRPAACR